jgi:hypothetical protein
MAAGKSKGPHLPIKTAMIPPVFIEDLIVRGRSKPATRGRLGHVGARATATYSRTSSAPRLIRGLAHSALGYRPPAPETRSWAARRVQIGALRMAPALEKLYS